MKRYHFCYLLIIALLFVSCRKDNHNSDNTGYTLRDEVVFSRHNIRSPLSAPGSDLDRVTPYDWVNWGVGTAHLTARGARIEQKMGEWFREDLNRENHNMYASLNADNTLIYSNVKQRTIRTAENFLVGFGKDLQVYHLPQDDDGMDPLFHPAYTVMNDNLERRIIAEMNEVGGVAGTADEPYKGIWAAVGKISDEIRYMEDVIGFKESPYAEENQLEHLPLKEMSIILTKGEEPGMTGDYKLVNSIADAVVLQYYETGMAFGKDISLNDMRRIGKVKTVYDEVIFTTPATAILISNPLVKKIKEEICDTTRKFTFFCGHDSNIASITSALRMKLPSTVNAVEFSSPIGSKIVFQIYEKDNSEFVNVNLVYASVYQLQEMQEISTSNPPVILPIDFEGLTRNADGFYKMEDVIRRFDETIAEFDSMAR
ncbi:MAG: histidine-type phosphatase [Bacteroidales bacterium]|nr:histidine-type phosphatase [Bacteroidales bacterium]